MRRQSSISFAGIDKETPFYKKLCGKYLRTFAYTTVKDRLPVILTKVVDQISRDKEEIIKKYGKDSEESIKNVIGSISKLKNEVQTNKPLIPLEVVGSDSELWNNYLEEMEVKEGSPATWFTSPWLYTENYLYRRIQEIFELSGSLEGFDPFAKQKSEAYQAAVSDLSAVRKALNCADNSALCRFSTAATLSLWSNRCDLSLSNGVVDSQQDSVLANVQLLSKYLLSDDTENAFQALIKHPSKIVDIVHDNSAYELFVDLCLAEQLLNTGLADVIRLRVKKFPWYVSDVTIPDIYWLLDKLPADGMEDLSTRWRTYINKGQWVIIADDFWTLPFPYCEMQTRDPTLYTSLEQSSLVIFKGDLNYRKLVGDIYWPFTTPFSEALQGFRPTNVLALRTIKADVVCGLRPGVGEKLAALDLFWMRTGQYAVIQFSALK